jgi:hypothetical protein
VLGLVRGYMIFKFEVVGIDHNYIPPMSSKVHLKYID